MSDQAPADDGWSVSSDDYDVTEFYTRGSDARGHGENVTVRVKPEIRGELASLVASGHVPDYTTMSDVVRDAIVHRLRWLANNADNAQLRDRLQDSVRRVTVEETTNRYTDLVDGFERFLASTRDICERALKMEDHDGLAAHLIDVEEYAANIRAPFSQVLTTVVDYYKTRVDLSHRVPQVPLDGGIGPEAG